jgi:tetracycline 7-halogenase / FADH2 O2-dependent halogenase
MTVTARRKSAGPEGPAAVNEFDVVILGSGLAGSVSAAILARHGAKVMLIDAASHPRFAIGESMTPQLAEWLHILAERYDVPEIRSLTSIKTLSKDVGPVFGTKENFGFVLHRPGQEPDPRETTQFSLPNVLDRNAHLFRQDSDSFMFNVACRYGSAARQGWRASDLDFDDDGVTVTGQNGEAFRARYLIDASGFRSPVAEKFGLRDARLKHHARSLFTHFIGVRPFDEVSGHPKEMQPPSPWNSGTLHHLIERGWFWIIPFNNNPQSLNPLCSVGLTIDERRYPKPDDMTAEQEWEHFLSMYPAVKRQFAGAHRVREWVSTGRLQYSSKQTVGHRWALMSHAAGFLDPLFSRGLSNTFEVVDAVVFRLLKALDDDDFSAERFEYVERLSQGLIQYNDDLVNSSYIAFSSPRLWNAVFRVWGASLQPATIRLNRARLLYAGDHDDQHFQDLENTPHPGLWWPDNDEFKRLLDGTAEACEKYEAGALTEDQAADIVFRMLDDCPIVAPAFGWKDPEHRFIHPNVAVMAKFMYWMAYRSPDPEVNKLGRSFTRAVVKATMRGKKVL